MEIDILVEIGTKEQQEAIKSELQMILNLMGDDFLGFIELNQIIIPCDFDATINCLLTTTCYESNRIQLCIGKTIHSKGKNIIVISPLAYYTEIMNFGMRFKFILHEIYHLVNRKQFKIPEYIYTAESRYTNTIAIMYDEYRVNRLSCQIMSEIINPELLGNDKDDTEKEYKGFISSLQNQEYYYLPLKKEYEDWRESGDTVKMLTNACKYMDAAIKDMTYCYSFADSFASIKEDFANRESVFLNKNTENVFDLLREWHAANEVNIDFGKGIDAIKGLMTSCFGIYFDDTPFGERFFLVPF
jgi:hypothetical protein